MYAFFCARSRRASNASPEATSSQKKCTHFDCDSTTSCDIIIIEYNVLGPRLGQLTEKISRVYLNLRNI